MKLIEFIARGRSAGSRRAAANRRPRSNRPAGLPAWLKSRYGAWAVLAVAVAAVAVILSCGGREAPDSKAKDKPGAASVTAVQAVANPARASQNPDKDALPLAQLAARLGPVPKPAKAYRLAAILPYYGEEYWQVLARGMQSRAMELGVAIEMPAATSAADTQGELDLAMRMLERGCDALLLAPISAAALAPAVAKAKAAHIPVLCLGQGDPIPAAPLIGPSQYETGVRAAECFLRQAPAGGKILVISGDLPPAALRSRLAGLTETLAGAKAGVSDVIQGGLAPAETMAAFRDVLARRPELAGVYCTSDALALAAAQTLTETGKGRGVRIVGSGGESRAYDAVRQGALTATIDFFAYINGQAAVDGALRLLAGQTLPAMIATPQNLITAKNLDNPLPAGSGG